MREQKLHGVAKSDTCLLYLACDVEAFLEAREEVEHEIQIGRAPKFTFGKIDVQC